MSRVSSPERATESRVAEASTAGSEGRGPRSGCRRAIWTITTSLSTVSGSMGRLNSRTSERGEAARTEPGAGSTSSTDRGACSAGSDLRGVPSVRSRRPGIARTPRCEGDPAFQRSNPGRMPALELDVHAARLKHQSGSRPCDGPIRGAIRTRRPRLCTVEWATPSRKGRACSGASRRQPEAGCRQAPRGVGLTSEDDSTIRRGRDRRSRDAWARASGSWTGKRSGRFALPGRSPRRNPGSSASSGLPGPR